VAAAALTSATVQPLMVPRFFLSVIPASSLIFALGLSRIPQRTAFLAAVIALVVLGWSGVVRAHGYGDWGWHRAVNHLATVADDGDSVVILPARQSLAFDYYLRRLAGGSNLQIISPQARDWRPPEATVYGVSDAFFVPSPPQEAAGKAAARKKFWVVTSDYTRFDGSGRVREALDEADGFFGSLGPDYVVGSARNFNRVGVLLIEPVDSRGANSD
jgi:hypothetical protein